MTVSSGFFNSVSGDRKYNAKHFNEIFDGLLSDGVYVNVGDAFKVTPGTGMQVVVGTGRGWFKNTWILNDAAIPMNVTSADPILSRIDAIVIDINTGTSVRNNSIVYKQGTAATAPDKPSLVNESTHKQYPIAWIRIDPGVTSISSNKITDCQRTGELPAVEALLEYSSHTKAEIDSRFTRDENPSFNDRTGALANLTSGEAMTSMLGKIKQVFATLIGHTSNKATFYRHDGTFATPPTVDTTQPGYCPTLPAYSSGDHKYLRDDGTWVIPPNTQNNNAVAQNSANNGNANYKVMLTGRAAAENAVESTLWDADLTYNPSTNQLNVKKIVGDSVNGVKFGTSGTNRGYYDANGNFKTFRQPTGNAAVGDVRSGKTFANASSDSLTGTFASQEKTVTSSRSAQTVTPDSGKWLSKVTVNALVPSGTYKPTARATGNDMGTAGNYRYVDTTAVPNTNSGTYTPTSRSASLDMGVTNTYRYVNTNSVLNTNAATYTYPSGNTGGTVDLGVTNTYRYVNASNVYNKGVVDADARVNTSSASYSSGRATGRTDSNPSSAGSGDLSVQVVVNSSGTATVKVLWTGSGETKTLYSGKTTKGNTTDVDITCRTNYYDIWKIS